MAQETLTFLMGPFFGASTFLFTSHDCGGRWCSQSACSLLLNSYENKREKNIPQASVLSPVAVVAADVVGPKVLVDFDKFISDSDSHDFSNFEISSKSLVTCHVSHMVYKLTIDVHYQPLPTPKLALPPNSCTPSWYYVVFSPATTYTMTAGGARDTVSSPWYVFFPISISISISFYN